MSLDSLPGSRIIVVAVCNYYTEHDMHCDTVFSTHLLHANLCTALSLSERFCKVDRLPESKTFVENAPCMEARHARDLLRQSSLSIISFARRHHVCAWVQSHLDTPREQASEVKDPGLDGGPSAILIKVSMSMAVMEAIMDLTRQCCSPISCLLAQQPDSWPHCTHVGVLDKRLQHLLRTNVDLILFAQQLLWQPAMRLGPHTLLLSDSDRAPRADDGQNIHELARVFSHIC